MAATLERNKPLLDILNQVKVKDVIPWEFEKMVVVKPTDTLAAVLRILASKSLLSVPVCEGAKSMIGFVDLLDVISFIIKVYTGDSSEKLTPKSWTSLTEDDLKALKIKETQLSETPISQLVNYSLQDWTTLGLTANDSIAKIIVEVFEKGHHRCPFDDEKGELQNVISQSDVIWLLAENHHIVKTVPFGLLTLEQSGLIQPNVITMDQHAQAIHAFYLMHVHHVSAVAIVNEKGTLVGNLSNSDIRGISVKDGSVNFSCLLKPMTQFFKLLRRKLKPPMVCTSDSTVLDAITLMAYYRLHRVWIVDYSNKLIGVVSISDINKFLAKLLK